MPRVLVIVLVALTAAASASEGAGSQEDLEAVLRRAVAGYDRIRREITDYRCILTRRERVHGELREAETAVLKVRHQRIEDDRVVSPFSVYLRFLAPSAVKGREVLYVHGRNQGKMIVRNGGPRFGFITTALPPDSSVVLSESRYPITEVGVQMLTQRLIEVGMHELEYGDCQVRMAAGARLDNRDCTVIQVTQNRRRADPSWKRVRILIDDELELPVYYAAYDWPEQEGGHPVLLEEYIYTQIELNVGLSDLDFDHRNEDYSFSRSFRP